MDTSDKKKIFSWAICDWANSAFATTIMAGFFPVFFKSYWSDGADAVVTTARLGTAISMSGLIIALLSPTLGVIADMKGFKKNFWAFFSILGIVACAWMAFIPAGDWQTAALAYGVGMIGFNASIVFYESFLPYVAKKSEMDYVSSLGYALGYLGGGVLFLLNVLMFLFPAKFGLPDGVTAVKVSFVLVAIWWLVFSLPLAKNLSEPVVPVSSHGIWSLTRESFSTLKATVQKMARERNLLFFIVAYWLYIDGVYTVMTMAVDYGMAIGLESKDLIAALLITQFIGFPFAYYFGTVTKRWGSKLPILMCIGIYGVSVVLATQMSAAWHFYMLATVIGMVQGGVQSLSRSLFARMIPKESSGEYFGFFNLVGRFASILGPVLVGFIAMLTGSSRLGMIGLLILFIAGGFLLSLVKEPQGDPS